MITPLRIGLLIAIGVGSITYIIVNIINIIKNRKKKDDNTENDNKTK